MDLLGCSCCFEGITQVLAAEQDISTYLSFSTSPQPFDASPIKDAALFSSSSSSSSSSFLFYHCIVLSTRRLIGKGIVRPYPCWRS